MDFTFYDVPCHTNEGRWNNPGNPWPNKGCYTLTFADNGAGGRRAYWSTCYKKDPSRPAQKRSDHRMMCVKEAVDMQLVCSNCGECDWDGVDQPGRKTLGGDGHTAQQCKEACSQSESCKYA